MGDVVIDGVVDDPAWDRAPVFDAFVQNFPAEGHAPTQRTEVRVLYDASTLYVAITCFDAALTGAAELSWRRPSPAPPSAHPAPDRVP